MIRYLFIFSIVLSSSALGQECPKTRPLTVQEIDFQSHTMMQLQSIFEHQKFNGYILDKESDSYPPQVWTELCIDRKSTETFNLLGYYTYVLDPLIDENLTIINQINSIDYSKGDAAMDALRNLGNIIRLECEWGINTIPFTLKNLGSEIKMEKVGDVTIIRLNNAYKEDSKSEDVRFRTVIVKGNIEVIDEVERIEKGVLYRKTIRVPVSKTHFTSRLNAFVVVTGGKEAIHLQLDTKTMIEQLDQLITK